MKFQRVLETVDYASAKVSDGVRTLAFAGFALIWLFKKQLSDGSVALDPALHWPAALLVLSLAADVASISPYCRTKAAGYSR
jgi:hypothetical protein